MTFGLNKNLFSVHLPYFEAYCIKMRTSHQKNVDGIAQKALLISFVGISIRMSLLQRQVNTGITII